MQLVPGLPVHTDSGALVSHIDRRGTRHLAVNGACVTPKGVQLRAVLDVDGEEKARTSASPCP